MLQAVEFYFEVCFFSGSLLWLLWCLVVLFFPYLYFNRTLLKGGVLKISLLRKDIFNNREVLTHFEIFVFLSSVEIGPCTDNY